MKIHRHQMKLKVEEERHLLSGLKNTSQRSFKAGECSDVLEILNSADHFFTMLLTYEAAFFFNVASMSLEFLLKINLFI